MRALIDLREISTNTRFIDFLSFRSRPYLSLSTRTEDDAERYKIPAALFNLLGLRKRIK